MSRAATRLDMLAEHVKIGFAVLAGLLIALAVWLTFFYFLLARAFGSEGPD